MKSGRSRSCAFHTEMGKLFAAWDGARPAVSATWTVCRAVVMPLCGPFLCRGSSVTSLEAFDSN